MAFLPAPSCCLFETKFLVFGQLIETTMYFKKDADTAWTEPEIEDACAYLIAFWDSNGDPLVCSDTVLVEIFGTSQESATAPAIGVTPSIAGTHTGVSLPLNSTMTVTFRTAGRGRSSRGRNYVPSLPEGEVVGNTVDTDQSAAWVAFYTDMQDEMASIFDPAARAVVVSRIENGAQRDDALIQLVTSFAVADNFVDSQRRRLSGRGQ